MPLILMHRAVRIKLSIFQPSIDSLHRRLLQPFTLYVLAQ